MFNITVERYANIIAIQIPNSKRAEFLQALKAVQPNSELMLTAAGGEQVNFKNAQDFIIDVSNNEKIYINLPPKDWKFLVEAVQEHLDENPGFPMDHSFEPYGAKIIPDSIKDIVIETIND